MLGEGVERVCQPTGRVPARRPSVSTVRAMAVRSVASSMCACFSQRQPWQAISWPRFTASSISQGDSSAASPQVLTVVGTPRRSSVSAIRHHAALVPYSKCDSMQRSGTPVTSSVTS